MANPLQLLPFAVCPPVLPPKLSTILSFVDGVVPRGGKSMLDTLPGSTTLFLLTGSFWSYASEKGYSCTFGSINNRSEQRNGALPVRLQSTLQF